MLIIRFRQAKNLKGVSLLEMIAAIAITAILAAVLSMMIVPVINTYRTNSVKTELRQAVTSRLNDFAYYLRGASGVYLSDVKRTPSLKWYPGKTFKKSTDSNAPKEALYVFPEIRDADKGTEIRTETDGVMSVDFQKKRMYSFVMDNYHERNNNVKGYLYPEMIIADWSNSSKRYLDYASSFNMKLQSDDYQSQDYWCPNTGSMYFIVRKNPDDSNRGTALEMHLTVKKGDISYEGSKTIVCENLVIKGIEIYTTNFQSWSGSSLNRQAAELDMKYYTVWFTREY